MIYKNYYLYLHNKSIKIMKVVKIMEKYQNNLMKR